MFLGFLAGIGGAIAGAFSCAAGFIGSGISAIAGAIGGFASSIGSALVSGATSLVSTISSVGAKLLGSASIGEVVSGIGKIIGLFTSDDDEDIDDLGCRACNSDAKPEDFDSTEQYIKHLKNDIQYDKEQARAEMEKDPIKKYAYAAVGATIAGNGISEKMGIDLGDKGITALGLMHRAAPYLTASNFTDFLSVLAKNGHRDMSDVFSYFQGRGNVDFVKTGADIKNAMSGIDLGGKSVDESVNDIKNEFQKSEEQRYKEDTSK